MNKKGFTLVELLAVLVVLGIVVGITIPSINGILSNSRAKSEEAFVETIKDAMDMYLSGNEKRNLDYSTPCGEYKVATIPFQEVIDSPYKPINTGSLMNPANDLFCTGNNEEINDKHVIKTQVTIYRNPTTHVYYYKINKSDFWGVNNITDKNGNFMVGDATKSCFEYTNDDLYISNLENPEDITCS